MSFEATAAAARPKTRADFGQAEKFAYQLLQDLGVATPPIDPVSIAGQLGVRVVFVKFGETMQSVSGFYDAEESAIYVNKDEYPYRQTFTVAHELGHHVMHRDWAKSSDYRVLLRDQEAQPDPYEQEANAFAAHLLVPRGMLAQYQSVANVNELSQLFLVSAPVIKNRMQFEGKRA